MPENPRPLAIHLVGHDSLPEDWERALRDIAEALSFYEGCRLPQEVVTTVRNAWPAPWNSFPTTAGSPSRRT